MVQSRRRAKRNPSTAPRVIASEYFLKFHTRSTVKTTVAMTIEHQLEDAIRVLLDDKAVGASVSTAEAAKRVGGPRWRSLSVAATRAAHRMSASGEIQITQATGAAAMLTQKSPLRVRRPL